MKRGLLLLVLLFVVPFSLAVDSFMVSFHSLGTNESITIDLVKYLNNPGPFKHSQVENVNIIIDNGKAIIMPKDPKWVGIEDIIFAPIGVEIQVPETPEEKEERLARQGRRNVTISKEDLDSSLGPLVSESFFSFTSNMSGEPINITGFLSKDSISLDINDEVSFNISLAEARKTYGPGYVIDVHTRKKDLYLPSYEIPSEIAFYALFALFLASLVILVAYFYTGYAQGVFKAMVVQERRVTKKESLTILKRSAEAKLLSIKKRNLQSKAVLKEAMAVVNEFFSGYLHVSYVSKDRVLSRLSKAKAPSSLIKAVASLYEDYYEMMYGKEEPSKQQISDFMLKTSDLIRKF